MNVLLYPISDVINYNIVKIIYFQALSRPFLGLDIQQIHS
jgi:hypothetical protein